MKFEISIPTESHRKNRIDEISRLFFILKIRVNCYQHEGHADLGYAYEILEATLIKYCMELVM